MQSRTERSDILIDQGSLDGSHFRRIKFDANVWSCSRIYILGGGFNYLLFSPLLGEDF